jgi:hypothetical protein
VSAIEDAPGRPPSALARRNGLRGRVTIFEAALHPRDPNDLLIVW